jgi:hypothetical protein
MKDQSSFYRLLAIYRVLNDCIIFKEVLFRKKNYVYGYLLYFSQVVVVLQARCSTSYIHGS